MDARVAGVFDGRGGGDGGGAGGGGWAPALRAFMTCEGN